MWSSPLPFLPTAPLDRLSWVVGELVRILWGRREYGFFTVAVVNAIGRRVSRVCGEMKVLAAALQAGTLRTRRSPAPGGARRRASVPAPTRPAVRVAGGFGWLVKQAAEMRYLGVELRNLLDEPEMVALLAASPRAVRAVRPLCRMLGVRMPAPPSPDADAVDPAPLRPALPNGGAPDGGRNEAVECYARALRDAWREDDPGFENQPKW